MIPSLLNNKTVWYFLILASYSPGSGYTRKEIQDLTHLDNLSIDRTIQKLLFHKVVRKEKRIIKLNFDNPETMHLLDFIHQEKKKLNYPSYELFMLLIDFFQSIEIYSIDSIYLFGSHAKKTASTNSDIDIAIFSLEEVNVLREEEKIESKFGKELQIHYFKIGDIKKKNKLVEQILKDGVKIL